MFRLETAFVAPQVASAAFGFAWRDIPTTKAAPEAVVAAAAAESAAASAEATAAKAAAIVVVTAATAGCTASAARCTASAAGSAGSAASCVATATATAGSTATTTGSACTRGRSAGSRSAPSLVGFVHPKIPTAHLEAVELGHGLSGRTGFRVLHKGEPTGTSGFAILRKKAVYDLPDFRENCFQLLLRSVEVEISHKQFGADDVLLETGRPRYAFALPLVLSRVGQLFSRVGLARLGP